MPNVIVDKKDDSDDDADAFIAKDDIEPTVDLAPPPQQEDKEDEEHGICN